MEIKHKMKLFLNDPSFKKIKIDSVRPQQPKQIVYRNLFPSNLEIQRFRHLEQARINTIEDMHLDKNTQHTILQLQQALKIFHSKNKELENKKQTFFGKFKMDYVEEEMNQNLDDLQKLVVRHEELHELIKQEKKSIQKSLKMTQIKKALKIQNQMLKSENEKLKQEQKRLDYYIAKLKK